MQDDPHHFITLYDIFPIQGHSLNLYSGMSLKHTSVRILILQM